jgi:hypothetical protein
MKIGDIVLLKTPMLGEEMHSVGVVFSKHDGGGIQVIFSNGGDDGFSKEEQDSFLLLVGNDAQAAKYKFKNVLQVTMDHDDGLWDYIFQNRKYRRDRGY